MIIKLRQQFSVLIDMLNPESVNTISLHVMNKYV